MVNRMDLGGGVGGRSEYDQNTLYKFLQELINTF